jgi:tetratricopeptide (TPR) repeat protein
MGASRYPRSISAALAWLVLSATPAAASPALDAQPKDSRVATYRDIVERGTAAFVARRFTEARQAFEQAFAINPDPLLVFNIASCWRRDGHAAEALVEYRRFLTLAPSDDSRRMLAEETIAALEAEASPAQAQASPMPLLDPPRPTRSVWRPIGLVTSGIGAASLIVGAVELVRAHSLATETDGSPTSDGQSDGGWDGRDRNGDSRNWDDDDDDEDESASAKQRAILFGAAGAAVLAAGVTMYVIGRRSERAVQVTASAGASGGQLVLAGRF